MKIFGNMFDQRPGRGPTSTRVSAGAGNNGPFHAYGPAKTVAIEEEPEMRVLRELLVAFPAFSLKDIAQAYTEADSDANAAAELLVMKQPEERSQEGWKNFTAERKINGYRSQEQPVVRPDDLLLEKYGRGVGELINNRVPERQNNSLLHNVQPVHDGASRDPFHLNNRTPHGVRGDNWSCREEVVKKEDSNGVSGDGALLVGRKKIKQKSRGGLENGVEVTDAIVSREAAEEFLLSMLGESSEIGIAVVRDVLGRLFQGTNIVLIMNFLFAMHFEVLLFRHSLFL